MSNFMPIAMVLLVATAQASLQTAVAGLLMLYQNNAPKLTPQKRLQFKIGKKRKQAARRQNTLEKSAVALRMQHRTRRLANQYLNGVVLMNFFGITAAIFVVERFFDSALNLETLMILTGVIAATSLIIYLFYYRKGTRLWLPRSIVNALLEEAGRVQNGLESFAFGLAMTVLEMPFTLALYLVAANKLVQLEVGLQLASIAVYLIIIALPLFVLRFKLRQQGEVARMQKWRLENKLALKILSGSIFLILAFCMLSFEVL